MIRKILGGHISGALSILVGLNALFSNSLAGDRSD